MQAWLQSLNGLDWTLILLVSVSVIAGFIRGIVRSLFALGGVIAGAVLAGWYCERGGQFAARWISSPVTARAVAFVVIFLAVAILAVLLGKLIRGGLAVVGLSFADRAAGAGFGLLRGYLAIAAILIPLAGSIAETEVAKKSVLLPCFLRGAHGISFVLPRDLRNQIVAGIHSLTTDARH